jgi:hypothetical protein
VQKLSFGMVDTVVCTSAFRWADLDTEDLVRDIMATDTMVIDGAVLDTAALDTGDIGILALRRMWAFRVTQSITIGCPSTAFQFLEFRSTQFALCQATATLRRVVPMFIRNHRFIV